MVGACGSSTGTDDETPLCAVTALAVSPANVTITEGNTTFLTAVIVPLACEDRDVRWSSSDSSIATVMNDGRVRGVRAGMTSVHAEIDSLQASADVTVVIPIPERPRMSAESRSVNTLLISRHPELRSAGDSPSRKRVSWPAMSVTVPGDTGIRDLR
ncbi:MAG: Ig-like domain-containing protein [Longimicrobiales bacterium]